MACYLTSVVVAGRKARFSSTMLAARTQTTNTTMPIKCASAPRATTTANTPSQIGMARLIRLAAVAAILVMLR